MKNYDDSCHANLIQKLMISDALKHNPYVGSFQSIYRSSHSPNDEHMWSVRNSPHVGSFRHAPVSSQAHQPLKRSLGLKSLVFDAPPERIVSNIDMKNKKRIYLRHLSPDTVNHKFPKMLFSSSDKVDVKCMICNLDFEDGCELRTLCCNHYFHSGCIEPLLNRSPCARFQLCPTCEQNPRDSSISHLKGSQACAVSPQSTSFSPNSLIDASFCSSSSSVRLLMEEDPSAHQPQPSPLPTHATLGGKSQVNSVVVDTKYGTEYGLVDEEGVCEEVCGVCDEFDFSSVGSYLLQSTSVSPVTPFTTTDQPQHPAPTLPSASSTTEGEGTHTLSMEGSNASIDAACAKSGAVAVFKVLDGVTPMPPQLCASDSPPSHGDDVLVVSGKTGELGGCNQPLPADRCSPMPLVLVPHGRKWFARMADIDGLLPMILDSEAGEVIESIPLPDGATTECYLEGLPIDNSSIAYIDEPNDMFGSAYSLCGVAL